MRPGPSDSSGIFLLCPSAWLGPLADGALAWMCDHKTKPFVTPWVACHTPPRSSLSPWHLHDTKHGRVRLRLHGTCSRGDDRQAWCFRGGDTAFVADQQLTHLVLSLVQRCYRKDGPSQPGMWTCGWQLGWMPMGCI
ncbi:hypothetical protein B0T19DRAFT_167126 [Cercophora scortea]|uniref:Uncharacterized protein n=1 Tax=Cercophora scortea TaxID=314031 RepID=A0AAE0IMM0_9PEZI|nr:hypothetical protein B0T19DRAFT_167126 [Cercophora scortea]